MFCREIIVALLTEKTLMKCVEIICLEKKNKFIEYGAVLD